MCIWCSAWVMISIGKDEEIPWLQRPFCAKGMDSPGPLIHRWGGAYLEHLFGNPFSSQLLGGVSETILGLPIAMRKRLKSGHLPWPFATNGIHSF